MKVALYNDTSYYHAGCKAVMSYLRETLEDEGHEIVASARRMAPEDPLLTEFLSCDCDAIVLNGEGSLHHNRSGAEMLIGAVEMAKGRGKRVFIVNALWQDMSSFPRDLMDSLDGVQVREGLSADDFERQFGYRPPVYLDFSYFASVANVPPKIDYKNSIVRTDFLWPEYNNFVNPSMGPLARYASLPMHELSWNDCVSCLKTMSLFVTGRHHGAFAAIKAETPFVSLTGNSHKIEGVIRDSGVSLPVAQSPDELVEHIEAAMDGGFAWDELFDWARVQPRWPGLRVFS